jgi:predicted Zn finger-like uncharacterized protein
MGSMHIVCPHCTTSYAIDPATLGAAGRTVRCSRCKEVWLARPEDAIEMAPTRAMASASQTSGETDAAAEWEAMAREDDGQETPVIDSPSISADWPAGNEASAPGGETDWPSIARDEVHDIEARPQRLSWLRKLWRPRTTTPATPRASRKSWIKLPVATLPTACAAMGALVLALLVWRVDVVRLLPQTATFYSMVGLDVNLRGLTFKDVKITRETVEGKPVLVIEGVIVGENHKPVELPRLRFSVRDAQGAEIYAWNAVLEQAVLKPGERAWFKSRLASPPPEGRNVDIRFFTKRDIAGGNA